MTLLLALLGAGSALAQDVTPFKFCYINAAQPPYYIGEGADVPSVKPGATIELLQQLDNSLEAISIRFQRSPQRRCLYNLELGLVDGVIAAYKRELMLIGEFPQTQRQIDPSRALNHSNSYCLLQQEDSTATWNGHDFRGDWSMPVAITQGDSIGLFLQARGLRTYEVSNQEKALILLRNKRVSGAALHCESATRRLDQSGLEFRHIKVRHPPLRITDDYLMISTRFYRQHPELSETIWQELARLRDENYERLIFDYMGAMP
ncbi:MAG: hypothetical protein R3183_03235 [Oleiphilaceae bacterium]|nr:hypothetical protein [Oleiphilaceae bacterium]